MTKNADEKHNGKQDAANSETIAPAADDKVSSNGQNGDTVSEENILLLHLPAKAADYFKYIFLPIAIALSLISVYYLSGIIMLFIVSFFFAYILNPMVVYLEKFFKVKAMSILLVYFVLFSLFLVLVIPATTNVISEISEIGTKMQGYSKSFKELYRKFIESLQTSKTRGWIEDIEKYLVFDHEKTSKPLPVIETREIIAAPSSPPAEKNAKTDGAMKAETSEVNGASEFDFSKLKVVSTEESALLAKAASTSEITLGFISRLNTMLKSNPKAEAFIVSMFETAKDYIVSIALSVLMGLAGLIAALVHFALVPVLSFYFLEDFKNLWEGFCNKISPKYKKPVINLVNEIDSVLGTFLRGQLLVCLIMGTAFSFTLFLTGVDFAFVIGPVAGILNIIYYLGPIAALLPSLVIIILKWGFTYTTIYKIVIVSVLITTIHLMDAFGMQPFIANKSFSMHPLTLMVLLFIGLQAYGLIGMFIAIPAYGVGKVIYKNIKIAYV